MAATIVGSRNRLVLQDCRGVSAPGNGDTITVGLRAPATVQVSGDHDTLRWRAAPGVRPQVSVMGSGDSVVAAQP